ncbi:MAG TPA: hypothetical protein VNF04_09130 [Stellaceae bacterium]|nr:hypothetical protein [Stellaceae bacterium]
MRKFAAIVFALLVAGFVVHNANAQMSYSVRGYGHRADPQVNNYLSARYDHLLQVSPRFRRFRMWKECHIITWPGLRPECIASFDQYEPVLYRAY